MKTFVFVDGGITPHNNPAFLLYRMATSPAYRLNWKTGEKNLLLVSVGTGAAESMGATASSPNKNIVSTIAGLSGALMYAIQVEQDINCRAIGRCTFGSRLDREMNDMIPREVASDRESPLIPLTTDLGRHFLYARYNADLSAQGLTAAGFADVIPANIQKMDGVENMDKLLQIGRKAGQTVDPLHLGPFI